MESKNERQCIDKLVEWGNVWDKSGVGWRRYEIE